MICEIQKGSRVSHQKLVRQTGGRSNEIAKAAVDEIRARNLLIGQNSILKGAYLRRANLADAYLKDANLQHSNLQGTNLRGANLFDADLRNAFLLEANLEGANLTYANLEGADLWMALFDENTTLPDMKKWQSDEDMERFTNSNHPDFWEVGNIS